MAKLSELKPGIQIVYIPSHANGRLDHPNSEEGFVTSTKNIGVTEIAYCRFWSKYHDGLRTKANSEACNAKWLVVKDTHSQKRVDRLLQEIEDNQC